MLSKYLKHKVGLERWLLEVKVPALLKERREQYRTLYKKDRAELLHDLLAEVRPVVVNALRSGRGLPCASLLSPGCMPSLPITGSCTTTSKADYPQMFHQHTQATARH